MPKIVVKNKIVNLNGDEMARFMTGDADYLLRLKVIMAMPKYPFLKALIKGGG